MRKGVQPSDYSFTGRTNRTRERDPANSPGSRERIKNPIPRVATLSVAGEQANSVATQTITQPTRNRACPKVLQRRQGRERNVLKTLSDKPGTITRRQIFVVRARKIEKPDSVVATSECGGKRANRVATLDPSLRHTRNRACPKVLQRRQGRERNVLKTLSD